MAQAWNTGEDGYGLQCGPLQISFQRYAAPESGTLSCLPNSLGQLPLGREGEDRFLLPVGDEEGVWIGLSVLSGLPWRVTVAARLSNGRKEWICGPEAEVAPMLHLAGIPVDDGHWLALGRCDRGAACGVANLSFTALPKGRCVGEQEASVRFLSFTEARRLAPQLRFRPIDRRAGYKGVLLP